MLASQSEKEEFDEGLVLEQLTHKRILVSMGVIAILGAIAGAIVFKVSFGIGIFLGGALAFLNYFWLKASLTSVFEDATSFAAGEKPRIFGGGYFLRYLVFGIVLILIYLTNLLPIVAIILGLLSFAGAVMIEGLFRIAGFFDSRNG